MSQFVETSAFSFAESAWLGLDEDDAPDVGMPDDEPNPGDFGDYVEGDGEVPTITTATTLSECSTAPKLSVTVTFADNDGLREIWIGGTVGEQWVGFGPEFEDGATKVEFTEVLDLAPLLEENAWNNVWLSIDVMDRAGEYNGEMLDLSIDLEKCETSSYGDFAPPELTAAVVLSKCDSTPTLTLNSTVTAEDGISEIALYGYAGEDVFDERFIEIEPGATTKTISEDFDLKSVSASNNEAYLSINVISRLWRFASQDFSISIDLDTCTFTETEYTEPEVGGDGLDPVVTVESVEVSQCETTPVITIKYSASDSDGISTINTVLVPLESGDIVERTVDGFEPGATKVDFSESYEVTDPQNPVHTFADVTDTADTFGSTMREITVDVEKCTVEVIDPMEWPGEGGDGIDDWDGPAISFDSFAIKDCNSSPVLTVGYTIKDEDGIIGASLYALDGSEPEDLGADGQTELSGQKSIGVTIFDGALTVGIEALDKNEDPNFAVQSLTVDTEACSVQADNT